ncbi:MAG: archaeosortase/exosortase family protein [Candidatus Micrarchaeia archaeon]
MKSISAEDKRSKMDNTEAFVVFAISIFAITLSSYFITPLTIEDTNPETYVIVPILMLPILSFFYIFSNIKPSGDRLSLAIGITAFVIFEILVIAARFWLSFMFLAFRVDLLLFPLAIFALATIIFGIKNVRRFKALMLYSLFASPAVLWPLLRLDPAIAKANTIAIFAVLSLFEKGLRYIAPITISSPVSIIGIGDTCISIGFFIALFFFLMPIAFIYAGRASKKALWITSGILLLLLFNYLRMLGISAYWLAYGYNNTVLLIHEFIGSILFYLTIVIMLLIAGKFGLHFTNKKTYAKERRRKKQDYKAYAFALLLSVSYFALTYNYSTAMTIPTIALANQTALNPHNSSISRLISSSLLEKGLKNIYVGTAYGIGFFAWNNSINSSNPLLLYIARPGIGTTKGILANNTLKSRIWSFDSNGTTGELYDIIANGSEFFVYRTRVVFTLYNTSSVVANAYVIVPKYLVHMQACKGIDYAYTFFYNIANPYYYNETERSRLLSAYCIARNMM